MPGAAGPVPALPRTVLESATGPPTTSTANLAHTHDWAATALGPRPRWNPALRTVVDLVLSSPVAMALAYGDDLTLIYNDGYAHLLGPHHPAAFGRPASEVLAEIWQVPGVGTVIERVYRTGEPILETETLPPLTRTESRLSHQAVVTQGYSAIRDSHGRIIAILAVAAETTQVTRRLQGLSELAATLASTLTLDDVARTALGYATSSFDVDRVTFGVDDGSGWRMVRRVRGELLDQSEERLPPLWRYYPGGSDNPLVVTARTGVPSFLADGQPLLGTAIDRHDEKIRALATLPLSTASVRGSISFGYRSPRPWAPADRALLGAAAQLVAQAAERARRFETQHGTAQLLQRSMLPEHLPDLPRLRLAARYEAGVDGNSAGGDFYDAFLLSDGRLGIALGDVAGHDVRAAALMGQVRAALRALALGDPDPATVLSGLDRLVVSLGAEARSEELFVTAVYGVIDPEYGRLALASAGHPAPLLRRVCDGMASARYLDVPPGLPLGLGGPRTTVTVDFPPAGTILLFSDGVVERRRQGLSEGFNELAAAVATAAGGDPRTVCAVATAAVAGPTDDDIAMLAVEHALAPSRSAVVEVPAEPTGPARVRRWLATQLHTWRVPELVIDAAVLCASELTTNALLHAGTAATVEIDLSAERLLVSVADSGTRGTVTPTHTDALSGRGRGLGLIDQLSDAWGTDPTVRGARVWFEILLPDRD